MEPEQLNDYMENISSRLSGIDNSLASITEQMEKGIKVKTREYHKYK